MREHLNPDCCGTIYLNYTDTGVRFWDCTLCGYFEHEPLKFRGHGYFGAWRRHPLFRDDPSPIYYANDEQYWAEQERRAAPAPAKLPVLVAPVKLAFDPAAAIRKDESENEVSFAQVWADPLARTIWLGYRGFMLASQYYRGGCMARADELRRRPGLLLSEHVNLVPESATWGAPWEQAVGAQLVPYLIYELQQENRWPYWAPRGIGPLTWVVAEAKCAA